jgi:hypothetical protein
MSNLKIFVDGTDSPGDWGIFQFPEDRRVPGFRETIRKNAGYTLPLGGANGGKVASGSCWYESLKPRNSDRAGAGLRTVPWRGGYLGFPQPGPVPGVVIHPVKPEHPLHHIL